MDTSVTMSRYAAYSQLTAASRRVVERCRQLVDADQNDDVWAGHLVLTLLIDESLASACLKRLGISREWLQAGHIGDDVATSAAMLAIAEGDVIAPLRTDTCGAQIPDFDFDSDPGSAPAQYRDVQPVSLKAVCEPTDPAGFTSILDRAVAISRRTMAENGVSSSHLLLGLVEINRFVQCAFQAAGVSTSDIRRELGLDNEQQTGRLPVEITLALSDSPPEHNHQSSDYTFASDAAPSNVSGTDELSAVWRLMDANLNRSREGLRVLEDHSRFLLNDAATSRQLKQLRHALVSAEQLLPDMAKHMLQYRDTPADVGTSITLPSESSRQSTADVVVANCRRVQESFRSLEEFGKLLSNDFSARIKQLRYLLYDLQSSLAAVALHANTTVSVAEHRRRRLQTARLYVLITEQTCKLDWKSVVEQCLAGGADVLQLREKHLNDRELLRRAQWLARACREASVLCIINDRADIAVAAEADGVHVGQEELDVTAARAVLQPGQLLGVSTHSMMQFQEAIAAGADYVGVGPTFPSVTKAFEQFSGLELIREIAAAGPHCLPWFAIGGIQPDNLAELVRAGCERIAVTAAVAATECPAEMCRKLCAMLEAENAESSAVRLQKSAEGVE